MSLEICSRVSTKLGGSRQHLGIDPDPRLQASHRLPLHRWSSEESSEARWEEADRIVDTLIVLAHNFPRAVRVWGSNQDRGFVRQKLKDVPTLDTEERIGVALDDYIDVTVPGIDHPDADAHTREWILTELKKRAHGNFLWASLMLTTIGNEVGSLDGMEQFIDQGLPTDLDGYYRRISAQYGPQGCAR